MYGVIALFDQKTENILKDIWKGLSKESISFYATETEDKVPHITIASYDELSVDRFLQELDTFYENKSKLPITLQSLGNFLNTSILYIAPAVTSELLDFHQMHHDHFQRYNTDKDSLYLPNRWVPHCTIANRLEQEKLEEAFTYCSQKLSKIEGAIEEIAVIETIFENGICAKAPIIYSKKLK